MLDLTKADNGVTSHGTSVHGAEGGKKKLLNTEVLMQIKRGLGGKLCFQGCYFSKINCVGEVEEENVVEEEENVVEVEEEVQFLKLTFTGIHKCEVLATCFQLNLRMCGRYQIVSLAFRCVPF